MVSDDEHHPDDDKEKSPSPKIEKKTSIGGAIGGNFSRSESESFLDAVTDFSDTASTGSATKTLDRDLFFSFKDAENGDGRKSLDYSVKDEVVEPTPVQSDVSQSEKAEFIDPVGAGVKLETVTSDGINEEIKQEKLESECENVPEVVKEAEIVHGVDEIIEEIKQEKIESVHQDTSEVVKEVETAENVLVLTKKADLDAPELEKDSNEQIQEVVNVPELVLTEKDDLCAPESEKEHIHEVVEEPKSVLTEKEDLGAPELEKGSIEQTLEVVKEPEVGLTEKEDLGAPKLEKDSNEEIQEVVNEPVLDLTESKDLDAPKLENCSIEEIEEVEKDSKSVLTEKDDGFGVHESEKALNEHTHEVVEEPVTVLTEKDDLGAPILEKSSKEHTLEVVQEPNSTLIEQENLDAPKSENGSKEEIPEVVKEPVTVLTEKDLGAPESEKCSNEHTHEVVKEPETVLTEKDDIWAQNLEKILKEVIEEPNSTLTEKDDLGAPNSENHLKEHTHEVIEEPKIVLSEKENLDAPILEKLPKEDTKEEPKVDSCVVSEPIIAKTVIQNQDSGVDLSVDSSSHNSLEGNWGSVSVLSTASIDDKPKFNSGKPDVYEPPSFMTLVEPEVKDQKPEVKDAEKAGWFPTIGNVSNESEGRKKNEEAIAKVTNWSSGKHSNLKNLLGEAKSPSAKEAVTVENKDECATEKVNQELSSPPKLIEDGKKEGKKVKGRSWMPFVCCSSVNVVN